MFNTTQILFMQCLDNQHTLRVPEILLRLNLSSCMFRYCIWGPTILHALAHTNCCIHYTFKSGNAPNPLPRLIKRKLHYIELVARGQHNYLCMRFPEYHLLGYMNILSVSLFLPRRQQLLCSVRLHVNFMRCCL